MPAGRAGPRGIALCAVGGYGRREMCPASDVDILLLVKAAPSRHLKDSYSRLLYLLWDLGFTVGHAIRSPRETIALAKRDLVTCTALLATRRVAGDADLVEGLSRAVVERALTAHRKPLLGPLAEDEADTLLEPEVKEGRGGLRDAQRLLWVAAAWGGAPPAGGGLEDLARGRLLSKEDGRAFGEACDFLLRVRHELHFLAKRRQDRLARDYQETVAHSLGYRTRGRKLAVEALLQDLYRHSRSLAAIVDACLDRYRGGERRARVRRIPGSSDLVVVADRLEVAPGSVHPFRRRPALLVDAFRIAAETRLPPGPGLLACVRGELRAVDRGFRADPEAARSFLALLGSVGSVHPALHAMHRSGLLGRYVPEFGRTAFHVQHDFTHRYTTDEHSLLAVARLDALLSVTKPPLGKYADLLRAVRRPEVLMLATLLHDVGKPLGHDHAERGALAAAKVARRLGLEPEAVDDVRFLVAQHLIISHTAERRDLEDPRTVAAFRDAVGSSERLRMLLLLTVADLSSISHESWTDWRDSLLWDLYVRASAELNGSSGGGGREEVPEAIRLGQPSAERPLLWSVAHRPDRGFSEIALAARDRLGLFADIAGVLSARGINILSARIRTRGDGVAMDVFRVTDPRGGMIEDPRRIDDAIADLEAVLAGAKEVGATMAEASRSSRVHARPAARPEPPRVRVDLASSDEATVIEVVAPDRVGLVALVARTLSRLGLDVRSARIATERSLALDIFYVRDRHGRKLTDDAEIARVGEAIVAALA